MAEFLHSQLPGPWSGDLDQPAADPRHWLLDPAVTYLNHGAFGACPAPVLAFQQNLRQRLERQPVQFLVRDLEPRLDQARTTLAQFIGADAADLVCLPNATTGVNTVLRSLDWRPGDELLVTNQEYNACRNALNLVAEKSGARVVVIAVPFPVRTAAQLVEPILAAVTPRTRLALLDHVTSQTGLVMPLEQVIPALAARGIDTLVDGAHAPGMIPLDLDKLGAAYYAGNCHKWLCAPRGAAFLHVRRERQERVRPLVISHGANSPRKDRSRFLLEFGWTGTWDPTAYLSVPEALRWVGAQLPGGWPEVMARNRALTLAARTLLCQSLQQEIPSPADFIGSLASLPVPDAPADQALACLLDRDPLHEALRLRHQIEAPVLPWPAPPKRLLRISAQLYNSLPQYQFLAEALVQCGTASLAASAAGRAAGSA